MLSMKRRDLIRVSALTAAGTLAAACAVATRPRRLPFRRSPPRPPRCPRPRPPRRQRRLRRPRPYRRPLQIRRGAHARRTRRQGRTAPRRRAPAGEPARLPGHGDDRQVRRAHPSLLQGRVGPRRPLQTPGASFLWYNPDLSLRACLAESWETNADASEWTFHLRKGARWSDGSSSPQRPSPGTGSTSCRTATSRPPRRPPGRTGRPRCWPRWIRQTTIPWYSPLPRRTPSSALMSPVLRRLCRGTI